MVGSLGGARKGTREQRSNRAGRAMSGYLNCAIAPLFSCLGRGGGSQPERILRDEEAGDKRRASGGGGSVGAEDVDEDGPESAFIVAARPDEGEAPSGRLPP